MKLKCRKLKSYANNICISTKAPVIENINIDITISSFLEIKYIEYCTIFLNIFTRKEVVYVHDIKWTIYYYITDLKSWFVTQ